MPCLWIFYFLCDLSEKLLRNHKLRSLSEFRLKFKSLGPHVDLWKYRLENLIIWIMLGTDLKGKVNPFNFLLQEFCHNNSKATLITWWISPYFAFPLCSLNWTSLKKPLLLAFGLSIVGKVLMSTLINVYLNLSITAIYLQPPAFIW